MDRLSCQTSGARVRIRQVLYRGQYCGIGLVLRHPVVQKPESGVKGQGEQQENYRQHHYHQYGHLAAFIRAQDC